MNESFYFRGIKEIPQEGMLVLGNKMSIRLLRCLYPLLAGNKTALHFGGSLNFVYLHLFSGLSNCSRSHSESSLRFSLVYPIIRTSSEADSYSLNLLKIKSKVQYFLSILCNLEF